MSNHITEMLIETIPERSGGGEEEQMLSKVVQNIPHHKLEEGFCLKLAKMRITQLGSL